MVFALAGCGAGGKPEAVVAKFCGALKKFDVETMRSCIAGADNNPLDVGEKDVPPEILNILKQNAGEITYSIGETALFGDSGTVDVDFTYFDISDAVSAAMGEYLMQALNMAFSGTDKKAAEELLEDILIDKMKEIPAEEASVSVRFNCIRTDAGWKIKSLDADVLNIMIGNMLEVLEEIKHDMKSFRDLP